MTTVSYLVMGETHGVVWVFFNSVRCILFVVMSEVYVAFCYQINLTVSDVCSPSRVSKYFQSLQNIGKPFRCVFHQVVEGDKLLLLEKGQYRQHKAVTVSSEHVSLIFATPYVFPSPVCTLTPSHSSL